MRFILMRNWLRLDSENGLNGISVKFVLLLLSAITVLYFTLNLAQTVVIPILQYQDVNDLI